MKTTTLRKGEGMPDLIGRLYKSGVDRVTAEKRLVEANPHLRDMSKAKEGVLVLVPEIGDGKTKEYKETGSKPVDEVLGSLTGLLTAARAEFEKSSKQQKENLKTSREALEGKTFKKAIRENPELEKRLPDIKNQLKDRSLAVDEFRKAHRSIMDDLDDDLRTMIEVVTLGPRPKVPVPAVPPEAEPEARAQREPSPKKKSKETSRTVSQRERSERIAYHVTYDREKSHWRILEAGNPKPLSVHSTKKEAVDAGRMRAQENQPSQIFIHKQDGVIQEERTYGDDPTKTKG
jgi:hypothetical protein